MEVAPRATTDTEKRREVAHRAIRAHEKRAALGALCLQRVRVEGSAGRSRPGPRR
nr:hypothetical protein 2 - Streptomyces hygroscopicus [Streptomyces hygroscopicus]